ncbi:type II toxin-antitoxin system PrlF family antitoxin [Legionella nautarum]|uniref:type II toxin-antitoxin system PrlF family antitoxin n=1 Tax=Legionella nautarum TaxID=45070 RepID=UPI0009FB7E03
MHYVIQKNGNVLIKRSEHKNDEPILDKFLSFLAKDIQKNPQNVISVTIMNYIIEFNR